MFFNQYPYLNLNDFNLDYILKTLKLLSERLENFIALNTIKYANPIQWNITKQYEANTVVIDANDGTAYLSVQAVPTGVAITNTDYWTPIFTLNLIAFNKNLTLHDDGANVSATFASNENDWLIWNGILYKVIRPIVVNESYVVGYNIERYTVEQFLNDAISAVNSTIQTINNRIDSIESLKHCIIPEMFGAVGDGITDDSAAMQDCIDYAITNDYAIVLLHRYAVYNLSITGDVTLYGGELVSILSSFNQTRNILHSNASVNIEFNNVKFNGNARQRIDQIYNLENMIRIEGAKSVKFKGCEIYNHAQSDINSDETAWYLRRIDAVNCIDCDYVEFTNCYIHDNHTEQIAIGSRYATTRCIIANNTSDNDSDAYALFLLFNLKHCVFDGNNLNNNKRGFINCLTNNIVISNNTFDTCEGRGIASEAWAQAMRLQNIIISNNYIANCEQGGIDCGIHDCSVIGNTIENCKQYAINMSGRISGDDAVVITDGLPWEVNTLQNGHNVKIVDNTIINQSNSGVNRPAAVIVRGEQFSNNNVWSYGSIRQIDIHGNTIIIDDNSPYSHGILMFYYSVMANVSIDNNIIRNYSETAIAISYPTGAICDTVENFSAYNNIFDSIVTAIRYTIANYTAPHLKNIKISNNIVVKPTSKALFASLILNSISGEYDVNNNITNGSAEVLVDNRFHVNGIIPKNTRAIGLTDFDNINAGITFNVGDKAFLISPTTGVDNLLICNTIGTSGTLSSVTCSGSANTNKITVNDSSALSIGNIINIAGISGNYIVQYIKGNDVYLASILPSNVTSATVSFKVPRFIKGLEMTLV